MMMYVVEHTARNPPGEGSWHESRTVVGDADDAKEAIEKARKHCKHDTASEWGKPIAVYPRNRESGDTG